MQDDNKADDDNYLLNTSQDTEALCLMEHDNESTIR